MCAMLDFGYLPMVAVGGLQFWLRFCLAVLPFIPLVWLLWLKRKRTKIEPEIVAKSTGITARRIIAGISLFAAGVTVGNLFPFGVNESYAKIHLLREGVEPQSFWADLWTDENQPPKHGWATFCKDFPTPFQAGMILRDVHFLNRGYCWSVAGKKHGYYIVNRQENGIPILEATSQ